MEEGKEKKAASLTIWYNKNPLYRSLYSDGAMGGFTPLGDLNLTLFATRNTIPKSVTIEINQDGTTGKTLEVSKDSKVGVIRELEVSIYMSRQSGKDLYEFLKKLYDGNNV